MVGNFAFPEAILLFLLLRNHLVMVKDHLKAMFTMKDIHELGYVMTLPKLNLENLLRVLIKFHFQ
jgi:hypothetical protein